MKLFRVSEEKAAPSWTFASDSLDQYEKEDAINVDQVNLTDGTDVSDETLTEECNRIEQCATGGTNYYYNKSWLKNHVSHLKEYALACGMDMKHFRSVSADQVEQLQVEASDYSMVRTASTETEQVSDLKDVWKDPFNIEQRSDTSHIDKADWETVTKASVIGDKPTMSGINAIRGSENYSVNIDTPLAANQNSITNPLAIEQLAEADDMVVDTGMRLRQEAQAREDAKKQDVVDWEQSKIDAMEHKDIIPEGHVFQTAPEMSHTGIGTKASQMANIDAADIPDRTQGEMLAEAAEARKASIQRPKVEEERVGDGKSAYRSISSDFGEALASALGK